MKLNKKIIGLILAVMMLASMALSLASCQPAAQPEEKEHTHTYAEKWSYDEENHWHNAVCIHNTEKSDLAEHKDSNYDNLCDVCNYNLGGNQNQGNTAKTATYIVDVKDAEGNPVTGVKVIIISSKGFYTAAKETNARGRVSFNVEEGEWVAAIAEPVEGYTNTTEAKYAFEDNKVTITLTK